MSRWIVDADNAHLNKKLKKFRSDRNIMNSFGSAVTSLAESDDHASVGTRKRGCLRDCYSYRLTKSHRLIYAVDYEKRLVYLLDLDDHKGIFGRDNRS